MSSSRFPGKMLETVCDTPMVEFMFKRVSKSKLISNIVIITSVDPSDDILVDFCLEKNINVYRGDLNDVLDRYYKASAEFPSDIVVRLTGDCPLIDPEVIDKVIQLHMDSSNDYTSNIEPPTFPDGLDVEVFSRELLLETWEKAILPFEREHVTPFMRNHSQLKTENLKNEIDYSGIRLTVDYKEDLLLVNKVLEFLDSSTSFSDIISYLDRNKEILKINKEMPRNEGFIKSLKDGLEMKNDQLKKRYEKSIEMYNRVSKTIPLASQTFSKSITQVPFGASPLFVDKADGARFWDIDGNEYLDFVNSLLCITLGYNFPPIVNAVKEQLDRGTIFSLPGILEGEVAELLVDMVPSAEMVRFGKNGSDVTSAAVRIARAATGKDIVISCGYHGWQDWYIGITSKNLGVPNSTSELTKKFNYNDIESLESLVKEHSGEISCVIMEPMNVNYPEKGFLEAVRKICDRENIVLIFDEMITGFRFSNGGAQEYFGVTPDMSCFGKGIANGYPISALVGKKSLMLKMEDIFFSGTFGGELLSLAAAKETLTQLQSKPILNEISEKGKYLQDNLNSLINEYSFGDFFEVPGHPSWTFFMIKESSLYDVHELKTFYLQEMFIKGIYIIGSHNISYAHKTEDLDILIAGYRSFFNTVKEVLNNSANFNDLLCCEAVQPLFKVR
jgi:glutamate-1-semialdehyde 2,1-aminomutase/spore coat polysaccharide biosynthesis protein SpsF